MSTYFEVTARESQIQTHARTDAHNNSEQKRDGFIELIASGLDKKVRKHFRKAYAENAYIELFLNEISCKI